MDGNNHGGVSQEPQINLDAIRIKKAAQDREQAEDLEVLVSVIQRLLKENEELKALVQNLRAQEAP